MRHWRHIVSGLFAAVAVLAVAQPETTWLERTYDFGVFKEADGKVRCPIRVVNSGTEPLLFVKAQASCGCTAIDFPQDPVQPGDTAEVWMTYNPSGRPGQFTKQAIIFTNTTPNRTILEITGNVIPTDKTLDKEYPLKAGALRISKGNLPFGELVRGKNKTLYLSADNSSTDTLLVKVTGEASHIRPAVVPDTVPPGRVTALTVHYATAHAPLWGLNVDTLTMTSRPLPGGEDASADILVMAQVLEDFDQLTDKERQDAPVVTVDCDDRLDFGSFKEGNEQVTRTFTITNKGKHPLIIRRLWIPDGEGFTVSANRTEIKRGKSATVTVTAHAANLRGEVINVPLTVMSNDPEKPRLTIRLVGINDQQ